jgi:GntR family transcriptional regulator, arabinose operon transcriptional repressor
LSSVEPGAPLYQQIKRHLRESVARGDYDPSVPFTTQRQIRERYGVSTGTAVRVLNELVSEGILVRRQGLGTFVAQPDPRPKQDSAQEDNAVAFIVHGESPHQSAILRGIGTVCNEHRYRVFVSNTSLSSQHEERALRQALESGTRGVILYPRQGRESSAALAELYHQRLPLVLVDRYLPGLPTDAVVADNFTVGYRLTEELIGQGHNRVATLWGETECTSVQERLAGHVQALRERELPIRSDFISLRSYTDLAESRRMAYLSTLLDTREPPTAFLCAHGLVLATVAHDLLHLGLRIPEDIDLAGMDDAGPYDSVPLACVAAVLPSYQMGVQAMQLLLARITADDSHVAPQTRVLPIDIRTRETSKVQLRPIRTAPEATG